RWGGVHPWRFGGPGLSHGAAILREALAPDRMALEPKEFLPAYTKIPNVYGIVQKERILIDASYVSTPTASADQRFVHHLVGFLPVLGASVDRAIAEEPRLEKVRAFLATLAPPSFPGPVDAQRAAQGKALFAGRCAKCHGDKDADGHYAYPNKRVAVSTIGTDPNRAEAVDEQSVARFNATAIGRFITVEHTGKYAPPPLWGVWANAPYFHNASVPTLWAVLKPEERPARFWVGGHRLDLQRVGVGDYPPDYAPWSEPQEVDTGQPGRSNRGHEEQVASYTDEERWQLIEYLKTL
ncbi:MAG TPA: hypothetical protein VH208_08090, partial [Myxococcaceae bacterium]|nr:hypothetical protein [Myxococcaceae bacterium]